MLLFYSTYIDDQPELDISAQIFSTGRVFRLKKGVVVAVGFFNSEEFYQSGKVNPYQKLSCVLGVLDLLKEVNSAVPLGLGSFKPLSACIIAVVL